ncbi:MAG: hypothetical protein JXA97_04505 [Anaerolineales bacterium]|nr:hypothetical protein [Anaerolineales bacterium]
MTKKRALYLLSILLVLFSVCLMLFHKIPDGYNRHVCAENYQLLGPFWVVLNCDAREFMRGAEDLSNLLAPNYVRQSRPGAVVLANGIATILGPFLNGAENLLATTGRAFHGMLDRWLHQYLAFILINFLVVFLSFRLYLQQISKKRIFSIPAVAIGSLLILNNIGKLFLLTPHTAIFEILVPLVTLTLFLRIHRAKKLLLSQFLLPSVIIGFVTLAYPGFLIASPAVVIAEVLNRRGQREAKDRSAFPWRGVLATAIMLIPISAWMIFLTLRNGTFQAAEFSGNELVWLFDMLRENPFRALLQVGMNMGELSWMALKQSWPLITVLGAMLIAVGPSKLVESWRKGMSRDVAFGAVLVSILSILFFAAIGLTIPRRAYMAVPALIALLGWFVERLSEELPPKHMHRLTMGVCAAVLLDGVLLFLQQGPYS